MKKLLITCVITTMLALVLIGCKTKQDAKISELEKRVSEQEVKLEKRVNEQEVKLEKMEQKEMEEKQQEEAENKIKTVAKNAAAVVAQTVAVYYSEYSSAQALKKIEDLECDYGWVIELNKNHKVKMPEDYKCKVDGNKVFVTHKSGLTESVNWKD